MTGVQRGGTWLRTGRLTLGALAMILLLQAGTAVAADPSAEPTLVIKLPSTMTPDELKQLVGELAAKGATVAPPPAAPPVADQGSLVWHVANRLLEASAAASRFLELRTLWAQALAQEGQAYAGNFWAMLMGLVAAALLVEFVVRAGLPALAPSLRVQPGTTLFPAFARHALAVALGVFGFLLVIRSGVGFLGEGSALLGGIGTSVAEGAGGWRIAVGVLTVLAAPGLGPARLLPIDDRGAHAVIHWVSVYLVSAVVLETGIWVVGRIGGEDMIILAAVGAGVLLLAYKIVMFFRLRRPIAATILAAAGATRGAAWQFAAASWHWVFIALSTLVFLLALEEFTVGNNPRAAGAATALQTVIVALGMIWAAKRRCVIEYLRLSPGRWWLPVASRAIDAILLLGSGLWLARLFGYDVLNPADGGAAETVLRPLFKAATTLAVAWLVWVTIGGFLGGRMPQQAQLADEDAPMSEATGVTRLATLLPLIRTAVAIAIFFLGVVIALGDLGVNIGPLLAGAGVVGIALGFGAQALVRDVIAGLFFLIDDAFRLGEYIDTGRLKGTVEAISIRSVRLRHQNGQVHTIPFGLIQAVTNSSRDWAIVKFNLHVAPDSDLELVRKTLKQLGQSMLKDPTIGGDFIQPLKMQGVADVTQSAIMIRCKFTARPVRPSYLRRQAMREIIKRFAAAGIAFATPPVNASNPL